MGDFMSDVHDTAEQMNKSMRENAKRIKKTGGPAFPCSSDGLTLRDYFAAKALQAIIIHSTDNATVSMNRLMNGFPISRALTADTAYQYADAMLAERSKP